MLNLGIKPGVTATLREGARTTTLTSVATQEKGGAPARRLRVEMPRLGPGDRLTIDRADGSRYVIHDGTRSPDRPDFNHMRVALDIPPACRVGRSDARDRAEAAR